MLASRERRRMAIPGRHGLSELARVFLKLGVVGFGGPAAHIAMMEDEVVRRRGWLSRERFLDLVGATNLIPGPNSTEMAIHVGHARAGWPGLVVAGVSFITPAVLIVLGCAWAYVRFGALPAAGGLLYGVKPVIIAVVVQALWGLGRAATRTRAVAAAGLVSLVAVAAGVHELLVLLAAGLVLAAARWAGEARAARTAPGLLPLVPLVAGAGGVGAAPFGLGPLFLFFLKVGSVLFGSGYVLLAFLRADLVERWGWLSEAQLLDAVAVGQFTPGPVFTTATFIGYLLGGLPGARAVDGRDLPAGLRLRRALGPARPAHPPLAGRRRVPRRGQRRVARPDGRRHGAARPRGDRRRPDRRPGPGERGAADPLPRQLGVAGARGRGGGGATWAGLSDDGRTDKRIRGPTDRWTTTITLRGASRPPQTPPERIPPPSDAWTVTPGCKRYLMATMMKSIGLPPVFFDS